MTQKTTGSEIFIASTETDPAVRAAATIGKVQRELLSELRAKTALLTELELGHDAHEQARDHLTEFGEHALRDYLRASDQALYAAGAGAAESRLLVRALRLTAEQIDRQIDVLAAAENAGAVSVAAVSIESLLTAHVAVEREVLLPALAALPGADLPVLVGDFGLLRTGGELETPDVVDVREIPHGQRHPRIFARFARLAPGEGFTLVNNHDPKPLRREFEASFPNQFSWDYLESGPEQWRVRISRGPQPAA